MRGPRTTDDEGRASGMVTVGQDEELVREFAQAVLERAAPEELVLFDETFADYTRDPAAVLDPKRREEAVGFGLELEMLAPYVLAIAPPVLTFLAQALAGVLKEESKPVLKDLVRRLFRRVGLARDEAGEDTPTITPEQADEVRRIVLARSADLKLPERQARLLADSVVGGLVTAAH